MLTEEQMKGILRQADLDLARAAELAERGDRLGVAEAHVSVMAATIRLLEAKLDITQKTVSLLVETVEKLHQETKWRIDDAVGDITHMKETVEAHDSALNQVQETLRAVEQRLDTAAINGVNV